jgi:hypothetical protein
MRRCGEGFGFESHPCRTSAPATPVIFAWTRRDLDSQPILSWLANASHLRDVIRREVLAHLHRLVPRIRGPWPITGITFRGFVGGDSANGRHCMAEPRGVRIIQNKPAR